MANVTEDNATETTINRICQALSYGLTDSEIGDKFVSEGMTPEDAWLSLHAAKILSKDF